MQIEVDLVHQGTNKKDFVVGDFVRCLGKQTGFTILICGRCIRKDKQGIEVLESNGITAYIQYQYFDVERV